MLIDENNLRIVNEIWKSPISAKMLTEKSVNFVDLQIDSQHVYWTENIPQYNGRYCLLSSNENGNIQKVTSENFNVSSQFHGYGGGSFLVHNRSVYFFDSLTQQVYLQHISIDNPTQLTFETNCQYGDFSLDINNNYLYAIKLSPGLNLKFPKTEIVRINLKTFIQEVVVSGSDFYSNIRFHPKENKFIFLQWNFPNMPWDENELWIAHLNVENNECKLEKIFHESKVSVYQPEWYGNRLFASINSNNYSNICEFINNKFVSLFNLEIDFSRPLWVAGTRVFAFTNANEMICTGCAKGIWKIYTYNLLNKKLEPFQSDITTIFQFHASDNLVAVVGGSPIQNLGLHFFSKETFQKPIFYRNALPQFNVPINFISKPKVLEFYENNRFVYANYYPPINFKSIKMNNESPPCIIKIHGGPTTQAELLLNPKIQYYTSRGFAYVELNYSGSSGYGKEYRRRLESNWGIIDVEDALACANYLINKNLCHEKKLILAGGSAGGFTALNTLIKSELFLCCSCHYAVSNCVTLAAQIHKFEYAYDQILFGGKLENNFELYKSRSPFYFAHKIKTPLILFHGEMDPVVPVSQSKQLFEILKQYNCAVELYTYEGEGHGFKKEKTIVDVLEKEIEFFNNNLNNIC